MIPKIIHYCWFGRNPLPKSALKCIASWRKFFPDYEIMEWNEDNFDVNAIAYSRQAYEARKYAFVSDYARFKILYDNGGLYFDTDVEVIKPFDDILARGAFMGIEKSEATKSNNSIGWVGINPGLGLGAEKGNKTYFAILERYKEMDFDINGGTVVKHTTDVMKKLGYDGTNDFQQVEDICIYPDDYFCPMDSTTGLINITNRSHSIHHYTCSWMNQKSLSFLLHRPKNKLIRIFGEKPVISVSRLLKR